jgi:hypothetical protein
MEINGAVQYDHDAFTITGRFKSGTRTITYDRKEVLSIEINARDVNSGEPPINISMFDQGSGTTRNGSKETQDVKSNNANSQVPEEKSAPKSGNSSVWSAAKNDEASGDVIYLRDKTKLLGRVLLIQKGFITIQTGHATNRVEEQKVLTVLIAPN